MCGNEKNLVNTKDLRKKNGRKNVKPPETNM
nr:MAG TPA: hypothetical protein [Caudoviricetes sp.]